jgi:hypothetical protein
MRKYILILATILASRSATAIDLKDYQSLEKYDDDGRFFDLLNVGDLVGKEKTSTDANGKSLRKKEQEMSLSDFMGSSQKEADEQKLELDKVAKTINPRKQNSVKVVALAKPTVKNPADLADMLKTCAEKTSTALKRVWGDRLVTAKNIDEPLSSSEHFDFAQYTNAGFQGHNFIAVKNGQIPCLDLLAQPQLKVSTEYRNSARSYVHYIIAVTSVLLRWQRFSKESRVQFIWALSEMGDDKTPEKIKKNVEQFFKFAVVSAIWKADFGENEILADFSKIKPAEISFEDLHARLETFRSTLTKAQRDLL